MILSVLLITWPATEAYIEEKNMYTTSVSY